MRIETYSDQFGLLRGLIAWQQKGLKPRNMMFLALTPQGRVHLALPEDPMVDEAPMRVGEKLAVRWPTEETGTPQRLFHFDSIHALRDDFCVINGDRRLQHPGNAIEVATILARFVRSSGVTSVFFGCTPHQPGTWLQGGKQVVSLHDYGVVEVVPVPSGLLARRLHDHRLYLLTYADIARTGHLEGWLPVYTASLGNILLVERRVKNHRLVLSCERGLIEVDLTDLPHVSERARLPLELPGPHDEVDYMSDVGPTEEITVPAVLGRIGNEAFVLTRGHPQPWGLRDLEPAEVWRAPTGEIADIKSWLQQVSAVPVHTS